MLLVPTIIKTYPSILKDITNIGHAPPASALSVCDYFVTQHEIAEPYEFESAPDNGQIELNNALELNENGSHEEAFKSFQRSAKKNNRQAQYQLGEMYFHGIFVKQDHMRAMDYYIAAANYYISAENAFDANDSYKEAFNKIGYLHENGLGTARNHRKAAEYYRQGAIGGNNDACCNLAYLYEHGFGVSASNAAAIYWYARAGINF